MAKTGSPAAGFLVGETLTALMVEVFAIPAIWADLLAFAAGYAFATSTLCGSDPPPMPVFTAADITAILTSSSVTSPASFQKLTDWIGNALWNQYCQCSPGATPAVPSAPSYPATAPIVNPPQTPVLTKPCFEGGEWFETNGFTSSCDMTSAFFIGKTIPPGVTALDIEHTSRTFAGPSPYPLTYTLTFKANDGTTFLTQPTWTQTADISSPPLHVYFSVPLGAQSYSVNVHATACTGVSQGYGTSFHFYCGALPGAAVQPCCPPDTALLGQIQQIANLLNTVLNTLPTPPNSYSESTVHAGLSGHGTITLVSNAIAIKVSITTDLVGARTDTGSPDYLFDRGYIVPITLEAPIRKAVRLVYNPQLYELPTLTEQIGYTLQPGETITITELTRGP